MIRLRRLWPVSCLDRLLNAPIETELQRFALGFSNLSSPAHV